MRTQTLDWKDFMRGKITPRSRSNTALVGGASAFLSLLPTNLAMAASSTVAASSWNNIWVTVLSVSDWLCVGVITFAGATWMFGNRSKAIELLIGASSGYLIIRHAVDIKNWLASL